MIINGDALTGHKGMGSHQSARMLKDEWLTPPEIIKVLGPFDLDPCAPIDRPWDMATDHYTREDDGLMKVWHGRVWLNPPYGLQTDRWLRRLAAHGNGIALTFARTETAMFYSQVWEKADGLLFIKGRLFFYNAGGVRAGAPSVLIAYGKENAERLRVSGISGAYLESWRAIR